MQPGRLKSSLQGAVLLASALLSSNILAQLSVVDAKLYFAPDAPKGWKPDTAQRKAALDTASAFFEALDRDDFKGAHALFAPKIASQTDLQKFTGERTAINQREGPSRKRVFSRVTWSKDPRLGSEPGVYAAIDFSGTFTNIDRYCGYIIVAQPPSGGPFQVRRLEENSIDNDIAAKITKDQSEDYLDHTWATVSRRCPNYSSTLPATGPLAEDAASVAKSTGFSSVADAADKLAKKPGVEKSESPDGWTTYAEESSKTVWSFAPVGQYAYPSMVQRQLAIDKKTGTASIRMSIICESDKTSCDRLVRESDAQNKANAAAVSGGSK